jgi:hypothetical protein
MAGLLFAGCDSDSNPADSSTETTVITGRVTDDNSVAKQGDVEDARVTAREVDDSGAVQPSEGETTTDANGNYTLQTQANADVMMVVATKTGFEGRTIVMADGSATAVSAMNINAETTAEADVYVAAKQQDSDSEPVTPADVALFVDSRAAADINANATTDSQVGAAIRAAVEAEARWMREQANESSATIELMTAEKMRAFASLQSSLHANATAQARASALAAFESSMADVHTEAGVNVESSAQARQVARITLEALSSGLSSQARFALRQRAHLLEADATGNAVVTAFQGNSSASARASAVAASAATLRTSILSAQSEAEMNAAWDDFAGDVAAEVNGGLNLGLDLSALVQGAIGNARATFSSQVNSSSSVDAIVDAKAQFESEAKAALESNSSIQASGNAEFAASVMTMVSAR